MAVTAQQTFIAGIYQCSGCGREFVARLEHNLTMLMLSIPHKWCNDCDINFHKAQAAGQRLYINGMEIITMPGSSLAP